MYGPDMFDTIDVRFEALDAAMKQSPYYDPASDTYDYLQEAEDRDYDDGVLLDGQTAWDCNPDSDVTIDAYDLGLDEEDDEGDWQVLALDRFGDRNVNGNW